MTPQEADDILPRILSGIRYIENQIVSYDRMIALQGLRDVARACQEAIIGHDDADRCDTDVKPSKLSENGGYLAG